MIKQNDPAEIMLTGCDIRIRKTCPKSVSLEWSKNRTNGGWSLLHLKFSDYNVSAQSWSHKWYLTEYDCHKYFFRPYELNHLPCSVSITYATFKNAKVNNFEIRYSWKNNNYSLLLILEALLIKFNGLGWNNSLKETKELIFIP